MGRVPLVLRTTCRSHWVYFQMAEQVVRACSRKKSSDEIDRHLDPITADGMNSMFSLWLVPKSSFSLIKTSLFRCFGNGCHVFICWLRPIPSALLIRRICANEEMIDSLPLFLPLFICAYWWSILHFTHRLTVSPRNRIGSPRIRFFPPFERTSLE